MRSRLLSAVVLLIGLSFALVGCSLLEQPLPVKLSFFAQPDQALPGTPITIVSTLVSAGGYGGVNVQELLVIEPDGTKHVYRRTDFPLEAQAAWAFTFPSPDWSGTPSVESKGIYTVLLQGNDRPKGQLVVPREGPAFTRTLNVGRGVIFGPLPSQSVKNSPLAYTLRLAYPSRGYLVEVQRGDSLTLPLTIQSRANEPMEIHLALAPAWRVPTSVQLETTEPVLTVSSAGTATTQITLAVAADAPVGDLLLYLLGETGKPLETLQEEAIPILLRIK